MKVVTLLLTMAMMIILTLVVIQQVIPALISLHDPVSTFLVLGLLVATPLQWYYYLTFVSRFMRGHYD